MDILIKEKKHSDRRGTESRPFYCRPYCLLRSYLEEDTEFANLSSSGREFSRGGALTENSRFPFERILAFSRILPEKCRQQLGS